MMLWLRIMQTGRGEVCYRLEKTKWVKGAGRYEATSMPLMGQTVMVQFPRTVNRRLAFETAENWVSGWIARGKPTLPDEKHRLRIDVYDLPF